MSQAKQVVGMPRRFKLTKKEEAELQRSLRYMSAKNLAKDFKTPAERRAMLAVFEWIALTGVCAWPLKPGQYRTDMRFQDETPHTGIILDDIRYEEARALLGYKPRVRK